MASKDRDDLRFNPTTPHRGHPRPDGFSLVEVVIALVILTVGILSVATVSSYAMWQVRRGQDLTNSAIAAEQVVEDISNTPFDSVATGTYSQTITVGGVDYSVSWTVTDLTDSLASGGAQLKLIQIDISGAMAQAGTEEFEFAIYSAGGA